MAVVEIVRGTNEPLWVDYTSDFAVVAGSTTVVYAVRRTSDGKALDFADATFKTSPGTATAAMSDSAVSGHYVASFDTSAIVNAVAAGTREEYLITISDTSTGYVLDQHTLIVGSADATHTLASTAATQASAGASSAASAASSAATAATQSTAAASQTTGLQTNVASIMGVGFTNGTDDLHTLHGLAAGAATGAALTSGLSALQSHGDSTWSTAVGFAVAGDQMALVNGAIAAAKFTSGAIDATAFAQGAADKVWGTSARTLTAATGLSALASQASVDALAAAVAGIVTTTPLTATETAAAVWGALVATYAGAGSFGALLGANINATIGSRLPTSSYTAPPDAATITAYVWNEPLPGGYQSGRAGFAIGAFLDTSVSGSVTAINTHTDSAISVLSAHGDATWVTATGFATSTNVTNAVTAINAHTDTATGSLASTASVSAIPAAVIAQAIAGSAPGSVGAALLHLDVDVSSRLPTTSYAAAPTAATIAAAVVAESIAGAAAGSVGAALATASGYVIPNAAAIAAAVWDLDLATYGTYAQVTKAGGSLYAMKIVSLNRAVETAGNPGTLVIYRDNGTTPFATMQLRDAAGGAVVSATGEPAQRAAAT